MTGVRQGRASEETAGRFWLPPSSSRSTRRLSRSSRGSGRSKMVGPDRRVRWCEGFLEKKVFGVLLARPDVLDLREQPAAVAYVDEAGRRHRHTFDAVVTFRDGWRLAVMVKRAEVAERPATKRLAAQLAAQLPAEVADGVIVMTEDDAGPDALHDARLINSARLHPEPAHDATLRDHLRRQPLEATVAELCRDSALRGFGLRAVARLLFDGTLVKLTPGRIAASTLVRAARPAEAKP